MREVWRALVDGLIHHAELLPKDSQASRYLREAAASLLDAETALERETTINHAPAERD